MSPRISAQALRGLRASSSRTYASPKCRLLSSSVEPDLKATLRDVIPEKRELLKQVKAKGDTKIGDVTVSQVIGGMRTLKSMVWEGSVLDADEGIRFHGRTIAECQKELPKGTAYWQSPLHVASPCFVARTSREV
jgi:citrate synthase